MISLEPVTPADCALVVGIPLTEQDFLSDLASDRFDYAAEFGRRRSFTDIGLWKQYDEKIARYIRRVCDEVKKDGVTVIWRATLMDFATLFQNHVVVTLVTHSVWKAFQEADILSPQALADAIRNRQGPVPEALRARLMNSISPGGLLSGTRDLTKKMVRMLEGVTEPAYKWFQDKANLSVKAMEQDSDAMPPHYLTRPALELAFPDLLAPGRAIEFRDGLHTLPELISAIPVSFSGILDLTTCNSSLLFPTIKMARPDCIIAANRAPVDPDVQFLRYKVIIKSLRRHPAPFGEVLAEVHSTLAERRLNL